MNERIKKLAEQCWDGRLDGLHFDQEQFAELIVRECAEVAGCNGHVSGFTLGDMIKQHFGIEDEKPN
jgi:hypothetical protein